MNRFALSLIAAAMFWQTLPGQHLPAFMYSPLQEKLTRFPIADIDFVPTSLQGMGSQLFHLVEDPVVRLFRNPAAIYTLDSPLLYGNFERSLSLRLTAQFPPLAESTVPLHIQPIRVTYRLLTSNPALISFNSHSFFQDSYSSRPALVLGYWAPRSGWFKLPMGVFFRGSTHRDNVANAQASVEEVFEFEGTVSRDEYFERITDLYGQVWLGILNSSDIRFGVSYSMLYHRKKGVNRNENHVVIDRRNYFDEMTGVRLLAQRYESYRHRFALGGQFSAGAWDVQPEVALLYYQNDVFLEDVDQDTRMEYVGDPTDSLLRHTRADDTGELHAEEKVEGVELDIQAEKGGTVLFFTGFFGRTPLTELMRIRGENVVLQPSDFEASLFSRRDFDFDDLGSLLRLRGGIGRRQSVGEKLHIYGALIPEYGYFGLSGITEGRIDESESLNGEVRDQVNFRPSNEWDATVQQLRLLVPVGVSARHGFLTARFGLLWHFSYFEFHHQLSSLYLSRDLSSRTNASESGREAFFGLGLQWKQAELNVAMRSDILQFSGWQVELRYHP